MKLRRTSLSLLTGAAALSLYGCISALPTPDAPSALAVPSNQVLVLEAMAAGAQIYECKKVSESPAFEWVFKAPEADLYDAGGSRIAHHYAGPTWEAYDGSKVVGEMKEKLPSPDPTAIPWLLLSSKSSSGKGIFAQTASIQRLNTKGGLAPHDACNQSLAGKVAQVPYTAIYRFYDVKR